MNLPPAVSADGARTLSALARKFIAAAVPLGGAIETTRRCNLRCVHCYLGDERHATPPGAGELDPGTWRRLIDAMIDAGCLDLLFTGGEPLLRPDFPELYAHARRSGALVAVFTNGTLVDRETAALLRDLPPSVVEVSVYGATAPTYERVTGVPGSFRAFLRGVETLAAAGVPIALKTMILTLNVGEQQAMAALAAGFGASWRSDPAVFPRLDGDRAPLAFRVSAAEAVLHEIATGDQARRWRDHHRAQHDTPAPRRLYTCGAGVTNFHVDPRGILLPCVLSRHPARNLLTEGFAAAWRGIVSDVSRLEAREGYPCNACDKRSLCGLCPPFLELESGRPDEPASFLCELGDRRRERMYSFCR